MECRGYRGWRFRKRYYIMHIPYIPRPDILGSVIAGQIPKDDEKVYQAWLEAERQLLASLEANFVTHLEVGPGLHPEKYHSKYRIRPSWFLPCSTEIEWIYIPDLDNEVFNINNRAHLKLDLVPHVDWLKPLTNSGFPDMMFVPSLVRKGATKTLVAPLAVPESENCRVKWG